MKNNIASIDIANYARMARRMFSGSRVLAICDTEGASVAASDDSIERLLNLLATSAPNWNVEIKEVDQVTVDDGSSVLIMNLKSGDTDENIFLVWGIENDANSENSSDQHDALMCLGTCIRTELQLQSELDHIALELSERYEELNLVYNTDDQVSIFAEGHEAFKLLVQNCSDYLDAGIAILYLRDKGVFIQSQANMDDIDTEIIRTMLDDYLYKNVMEGNQVEFINNSKNTQAYLPLPYRIMAGPIHGFGENPTGVLLIANPLSEARFSNSDKNLLAVMSRKAAKITQGSYDGLTGLINRSSFEHLLEKESELARAGSVSHSVLHLNIDQLHRINETLGYECGDEIIKRVASVVSNSLRDTDKVARLGGDEIGIFIYGCRPNKGAKIGAEILSDLAEEKIVWGDEEINFTASIGVACINEKTESAEHVLKQAVTACDHAKEQGGKKVQVYGVDDTDLAKREANMWMVGTVHTALRDDKFLLYAQNVVPLKASGTAHVEILLRMREDNKLIAPNQFIPASERYQLMAAVDRWVVENSLIQIGEFLENNPLKQTVFGINLSGQSFCNSDFQKFFTKLLQTVKVPASQLCFEITETAAISNLTVAQQFMSKIRGFGCKVALDDFGVGLSSFGYLKAFDVDYLKIDGSLVKDIATDDISAAMVESINQVAHVMNLETIAEFVETAQTKDRLTLMGVDYAQGYLLGVPIPLQECLARLAHGQQPVAIT